MSSIKYVPVPINERIPEKLSGLGEAMDAHSVVVNRTTREVLPTTGTSFSYAATNILEFVISDSGYIDFQTMAMTYNLKVQNAAAALTCAENGYSVFRRMELLVNGVVVSVIDNVGQVVGNVVASTASQEYYDSVLSRSGFWLDSKSIRSSTAAGVAAEIPGKAAVVAAQQQSAALGQDIFLDLMPLVRMFSLPSFFPARNVSNITLRLYLATPAEALINPTNLNFVGGTAAYAADNTATYSLSAVKLNFDSVQLTPSFTQSYDAFIASTAGMPDGGLSLLTEDYTSQRSLVGQGQEVDILLSKACKYLCSVYGSLHQTTDLTSTIRIKTERQKIANLTGVQVNIGGVYYPNVRPLSRAQVLAESDKAWNRNYDILGHSLQNQTTAAGFSVYVGNVAGPAGNFDDTDAALTDTAINAAAAGLPETKYGFINHGCFGVNTEQIIMGSGSNTLNGVSLTGGAPAIMKLYANQDFPGGALGLSLVAILYYKKIIKIRGDNNVEVIE
jgi:hypothetical protein